MPLPTLLDIQRREELVVDVYGNGVFTLTYLPSKLSKPILKKVQALAALPDWEDKADSNTTFLNEIIYRIHLAEVDENGEVLHRLNPDGTVMLDTQGNPVEIEMAVTPANIEKLGFAIQKDITKAINEHYQEFMKEGEETGGESESVSPEAQGSESTSPGGTSSSAEVTESDAVPGSSKGILEIVK